MILILLSLIGIFHFTESQLNIDPLSLYVDPHLYRLCWNQTNQDKIDYLTGSTYASKNITFKVFQDLHQSDKTFCIEKVDKDSSFTIGIPFVINKKKFLYEIIVKFSMEMAAPWKIIRIQVVPKGIHFQLNPKFVGISNNNSPSCKVILLSKASNNGPEEIIQFDMDSHALNSVFKKLDNGSSFTVYYSCYLFTFVEMSSSMISEHGTIFDQEQTFPLQPFIQIPFRRFILCLWKHPANKPDSYLVVIRSELKGKKCIRKFRLLRKDDEISSQILKFDDVKCNNIVNEIDLGFYNGNGSETISVVLTINKLMKINTRYKLSIYWKDPNNQIRENFIFFTLYPNENSANINPNFLNPNLSDYENLRNDFQIPYQNVASENLDYPIKSYNISALGYNDVFIIPAISESSHVSKSVIQSETQEKLIQMCKGIIDCSEGFYPFFYSLFTIRTDTIISTEIIEIPKRENSLIIIENLDLLSHNKSSSFYVSWQVSNNLNSITPSFYLLIIKATNSGKCMLACYIKCRTCNTVYKSMSEENTHKNISQIVLNCDSVQIVENNYDVLQKHISFQTDQLPHSIHLIGLLYSVQLHSYFGPILSKSNMIFDIPKENSFWIPYVIIFPAGLVFGIIVFCVLLEKYKKSPKARKEQKAQNAANEMEMARDMRISSSDNDSESNKYDEGYG